MIATNTTPLGWTVAVAIALVTLIFAGRQTQNLARQTRQQNVTVKSANSYATLTILNNVYVIFLAQPALRKYFYDGVPCPAEGDERTRVLVIAEMFCDVLETFLATASKNVPPEPHYDWHQYVTYLLKASPAFAEWAADHPGWYPMINKLRETPASLLAGSVAAKAE
jgi:hypothetical protein